MSLVSGAGGVSLIPMHEIANSFPLKRLGYKHPARQAGSVDCRSDYYRSSLRYLFVLRSQTRTRNAVTDVLLYKRSVVFCVRPTTVATFSASVTFKILLANRKFMNCFNRSGPVKYSIVLCPSVRPSVCLSVCLRVMCTLCSSASVEADRTKSITQCPGDVIINSLSQCKYVAYMFCTKFR